MTFGRVFTTPSHDETRWIEGDEAGESTAVGRTVIVTVFSLMIGTTFRRSKRRPLVRLLFERGGDDVVVEEMLIDEDVPLDPSNALILQVLDHLPEIPRGERRIALPAQHEPGHGGAFGLAVETGLEPVVAVELREGRSRGEELGVRSGVQRATVVLGREQLTRLDVEHRDAEMTAVLGDLPGELGHRLLQKRRRIGNRTRDVPRRSRRGGGGRLNRQRRGGQSGRRSGRRGGGGGGGRSDDCRPIPMDHVAAESARRDENPDPQQAECVRTGPCLARHG